jgi:hypothetical protein
MNKTILIVLLSLVPYWFFGQTKEYRTNEDGISKLINNQDFINDVMNLGTEELTLDKLDNYLGKYIPEYANFKLSSSKLDFDNLYFANSSAVSTEQLANKMAVALKLNPQQSQMLQNAFNGTMSYTSANTLSKGYGNMLYERGKDPKVDYAVDYTVDFFQGKFGDGGIKSDLIDLGGGVLGNLVNSINLKYEEKMAKEAAELLIMDDFNVYNSGPITVDSKNYANEKKTDQTDLLKHYSAKQKMPHNNGIAIENTKDYVGAITLFNETIDRYRQNPDRAYYLYQAYTSRGNCKMQIGNYKAAVVDFYFAYEILENILNGKLPDKSFEILYPKGYFDINNKKTYGKGKTEIIFGTLKSEDLVVILLNRAFAKYRAKDYNGALLDVAILQNVLLNKNVRPSGKANDYKDFALAIVAMSQYELKNYEDSYTTFTSANLNDDLIADKDNDGITNFLDLDDQGKFGFLDKVEGFEKLQVYGLPDYFPFDIIQIKGLIYYKAGKIDDAIVIYENLLSSENTNLTYGRGSKKAFTKAGGDISAVNSGLASFYFSKREVEKSIKLLDAAISLNPNQLEYYNKRGVYKKAIGKTKEAELDFAIVKDPDLLKKTTFKKNKEYFDTKYAELLAASKKEEEFKLLKEAIQTYPENEMYLYWVLQNLKISKNPNDANEISNLYVNDKKYFHLMKSLSYYYAANPQKEEEEIFLAFENGLGFYDLFKNRVSFSYYKRPYYCKLLSKYISQTNNNFIAKDFDKAKVTKTLDSTYVELDKQYKNLKGMSKMLEDQKKKDMAKNLGDVKQYLDLLNENLPVLEMSALFSIDKIECLFILNRKEEAIAFAKKIFLKGKLILNKDLKPETEFLNDYYYAIENIANGPCD